MDRITRESRRRPRSDGLRCGEAAERDEDGVARVVFRCNLPADSNLDRGDEAELTFSCREPSCGALESGEDAAELDEEDRAVDPNFFDGGYSMAGSTGFKIWTGSRLLIEALAWPRSGDPERLARIQRRVRDGARSIELGSGVGVVGAYLAALGSEVLLTDLPTLVEEAIEPNVLRNEATVDVLGDGTRPSWLGPDAVRVGKGWANSVPLDWTRPLDEQMTREQSTNIDFVVASDVVFLSSMLSSLLETVGAIFEASSGNDPSFVLSFQRRDAKDGEESSTFTTVRGVIASVERRGWSVECLAWRPVTVMKETDGKVVDDASEVFVFEIKP